MTKRKVQKARAKAKRENKRARREKLKRMTLAEAGRKAVEWLVRPGRFTPS